MISHGNIIAGITGMAERIPNIKYADIRFTADSPTLPLCLLLCCRCVVFCLFFFLSRLWLFSNHLLQLRICFVFAVLVPEYLLVDNV